MVDKKIIAENVTGFGLGMASKTVLGAAAWPVAGISTASTIVGNYLANPERNIDKLIDKEGEREPSKRRDVIAENHGFREEYKRIHDDRGMLESVARSIPKAVLGEMVGDKLHVTNQFKTMMNSGGSMEEFKDMKKSMPDLALPAYVKFRDEANEEAHRIGNPKRELGEDAKKAGVKDYDTGIEYLKDKFIQRGTKMQYNSVEKDLWGRGYLFSDANKSADEQAVADNNPHTPAQDSQTPPKTPQAPLASHNQIAGLASNLKSGMQQTSVSGTNPDELREAGGGHGAPNVNGPAQKGTQQLA